MVLLGSSKPILALQVQATLLAFSMIVGVLFFKATTEVREGWSEKGKENATKLSALIESQLFFFWINVLSILLQAFGQLKKFLNGLILTIFASAFFAFKEEWRFRSLYPTFPLISFSTFIISHNSNRGIPNPEGFPHTHIQEKTQ